MCYHPAQSITIDSLRNALKNNPLTGGVTVLKFDERYFCAKCIGLGKITQVQPQNDGQKCRKKGCGNKYRFEPYKSYGFSPKLH